MVKIKECYSDYVTKFHIGETAFKIMLSKDGFESTTKELVDAAKLVRNVWLTAPKGEDVFDNQSDLRKLCSELESTAPDTRIVIETNGRKKPSRFNMFKNLEFVLYDYFDYRQVEDVEQYNTDAFKWFRDANTKFVFDADNHNDIEQLDKACKKLMLPNKNVFLSLSNFNKENIGHASLNGFNLIITVSFDYMFDMEL